MVIIPFTSEKEVFTCQLGDYLFRFRSLFNDASGVWHFDLSDATTDEMLCYQIPILIGLDILAPMNMGIGTMIAVDTSGADLDAGPDDLGTRVIVFYYAPSEWVRT
jgi:hypothetical protein